MKFLIPFSNHGEKNFKRLVTGDAASLGILRALVCGVFLVSVLLASFENLGRLPVTLLLPTGVIRYVPWSFYDQLLMLIIIGMILPI